MIRQRTAGKAGLQLSLLLLTFLAIVFASAGFTQSMDANLNMAKRTIAEVGSGLDRLEPGDVPGFNRISAQLSKAAELLKASKSRTHPDFAPAVERWGQERERMAQVAAQWKAAQGGQAEKAKSAPAQPAQSAGKSADLDAMMTKYRKESLPALAGSPSPEQARAWAMQMRALQTSTLKADLATIDTALRSGIASEKDGKRVRTWISGNFQRSIEERVTHEVQLNEGIIRGTMPSADLINAIAPADKNKIYNFAAGENGKNNKARLDDALRAGAVAQVYDEVFGVTNPERGSLLAKIKASRTRLAEFEPIAAAQAKVLASAPQKKRAVTEDFLAPIAQKFWLNGNVAAESDSKGGIWINSNQVGDITHKGKIWVASNERGSIEPDGKVWFDGNHVGSLEPNGKVWRGGNQVGLIEQNGKVWINSNATGKVVPFQGEWRRAAILYYFRDFFK